MLVFVAKVIRTESGQMRDRLRAVELLAKMCGWNQPEKFEHGAGPVHCIHGNMKRYLEV
jgi:hypothetical protein